MKPFPWRPGMLDSNGHRILAVGPDGRPSVWAVERYGEPRIIHYQPFMGDLWERCQPDPNDGATKGALLDMVREAWGFPDLYPRRMSEGRAPHVWSVTPPTGHEPPFREGWGFVVGCAKGHELARRVGIQPSEFAALLAAWEAAP